MKSKKKLWRGLTYTFAFVTALGFTVGSIMESYTSYVDAAFGTQSTKIVTETGETYDKFKPNQKYYHDGKGDSYALIDDAIKLGAQVGAEGTVLLKNDGALPFASKSKITMLGVRSVVPLVGAGMGVKAMGSMITLDDGLTGTTTHFKDADHIATYYNRSTYGGQSPKGADITEEDAAKMDEHTIDGADLEINPTVKAAYKAYAATTDLTNNDSIPDPSTTPYDNYEPTISQVESYDSGFENSFANYHDAAIVWIGRPSNESYDYWKGGVKEDTKATEPLQITANEKEAIELAKSKFDKVIVLINSASPMDVGELQNDEKINAIAYVGQPGTYGFLGVAQVLAGKVAPSGRLPDTWAANQLSAPAMKNFGDYTFSNADQANRTTMIGGANTSKKYVIEQEGIYTGYKYYETRYYDTVVGKGNASGNSGVYYAGATSWSYDNEVTYPFGYGLSYASFEKTLVGEPVEVHNAHEWTLTFKVHVKNTSTKYTGKAKEVVEIYGSAPYTSYDKNGLEKSAVNLMGFGKTKELAPGEEDDVTIKVDLQDVASYDSTHDNHDGTKGTYVLEKGDYYFAVGNGAHEAVQNVLKAQGNDVTGDNVNSKLAYKKNISSYDDETFSVSKNGTKISNQIPYADWNYYNPETKITYLSRADWVGTYPEEHKNMKASESLLEDLNAEGDNYYKTTENSTKQVTWGEANGAKLASMYNADWNDSRWDDLLDQITLEEAIQMVMYGGPNLAGAKSIGWNNDDYLTENSGSGLTLSLSGTKDPDAPWAISADDNNAGWKGGVFANAPTTAASFNTDLWYDIGEFIGEESLFVGIPFLWGPGLNTHRTSYNGRTGEYYSEDGLLAGNVAMEYSNGAITKGLIAAPKHFAFNDQETNRAGVAPFMTEQRARETELKAYQIAVESTKYDELLDTDCGMRGVMTSFSKIGGVEVTCSYGLMTNILQNEWGFHGYAVTDIYDDTDLFDSVAASGVTCFDLRGQSSGGSGIGQSYFKSQKHGQTHSVETYAKDAELQSRLKLAVKNLVWVTGQSNYMNRFNENSHSEWVFTSWRALYIIGGSVFAVLTAGALVMYVLASLKKEEK